MRIPLGPARTTPAPRLECADSPGHAVASTPPSAESFRGQGALKQMSGWSPLWVCDGCQLPPKKATIDYVAATGGAF
jgi:hypothetical protein